MEDTVLAVVNDERVGVPEEYEDDDNGTGAGDGDGSGSITTSSPLNSHPTRLAVIQTGWLFGLIAYPQNAGYLPR